MADTAFLTRKDSARQREKDVAKTTKAKPSLGPRIRRRRRQLAMTLQQLGAASGVSVGYLSQVERDNATPTLGTLLQIAEALSVPVDYFVATPHRADAMTRGDDRPKFSVDGTSVIYERIGAEFPGHELSSYILNVPPRYTSEIVSHEGEEIIFILEGAITQVIDGKEYPMKAGDSLHYLGSHPHGWSNPTDEWARIFWAGKMDFGAASRGSAARPALATERTTRQTAEGTAE